MMNNQYVKGKQMMGTKTPMSMGMSKGGMSKTGYAKGGMVKANCGASMKPTQKMGKK